MRLELFTTAAGVMSTSPTGTCDGNRVSIQYWYKQTKKNNILITIVTLQLEVHNMRGELGIYSSFLNYHCLSIVQ